jgi:hypothetical protein
MISTAAQNLLKYIPLPNINQTDPTLPNYSGGASDVYNGDAITGRADYFYSDNLRFFDRYTFTQFTKSAPGLFGAIAGGPQLNQLGYTGSGDTRPQSNSFGFDKTLRPTLLTDFRFGWYKQRINVDPLANGDYATQAGAMGLNIPSDPLTNNMPHFSIQGQGGFDFGNGLYNNCNCPLIERMQEFQVVNNWTWTKGNHTIKFGPDVRRLQNLRIPSDQHRSGELTTPGDAHRNSIIGPGWFDTDFSLQKSFPIKERLNTQFRWEIYNLTNHPNLGNPGGCVDCIGGNVITGLNGNATMRRMQIALLFQF